jgi:c(7)-type cytochrome triheme protein
MHALVFRSLRLLVALLLASAFQAVSLAASEGSVELRLPPDVTYSGVEASPGPVVFSHAMHVPLAEQRCVACHPALFSILHPTRGITHDAMNVGEKCGSCHDGTKASGVQDACEHCHQMVGDR